MYSGKKYISENELREWVGLLPQQPWATKHVGYVVKDRDGTTQCSLCHTGFMPKDIAYSHFLGSRHEKTYNAVKDLEVRIIEEKRLEALAAEEARRVADLQVEHSAVWNKFQTRVTEYNEIIHLISEIRYPPWQNTIHRSVIQFLIDGSPNASIPIQYIIFQYFRMEKVALLELAIWKSFLSSNNINFDNESHDQIVVHASKAQLMSQSGAQIIIPFVLQFVSNDGLSF
jgi:hypothetical protein